MSKAISRPSVTLALIQALETAEKKYSEWTGGITMRAAPESLVQTIVAEHVASLNSRILLEASVVSIILDSGEELPEELPRNKRGRIDIAIYYKSRIPRFVVEIKKLSNKQSLNEDHDRIVKLMQICPKIQNGLMLGYATSDEPEKLLELIKSVSASTNTPIVRTLKPIPVIGRNGLPRFLAGAVYRVGRMDHAT